MSSKKKTASRSEKFKERSSGLIEKLGRHGGVLLAQSTNGAAKLTISDPTKIIKFKFKF